jgi:hypothetical protein
MIAILRRCLTGRAVLLLASPALGGTLLPALHPCPVDMPWLTAPAAQVAHAGHHGGGEHHVPGAEHHGQTCHCIGSCLVWSAVAAPAARSIAVQVCLVPVTVLWPVHDASLDLAPRSSLLPPSTAPPQA